MPAKRGARFRVVRPNPKTAFAPPLLDRLQRLIYEFHELGYVDEAKPFILHLMKLAKIAEDSR